MDQGDPLRALIVGSDEAEQIAAARMATQEERRLQKQRTLAELERRRVERVSRKKVKLPRSPESEERISNRLLHKRRRQLGLSRAGLDALSILADLEYLRRYHPRLGRGRALMGRGTSRAGDFVTIQWRTAEKLAEQGYVFIDGDHLELSPEGRRALEVIEGWG
jgi:hypothetical protein